MMRRTSLFSLSLLLAAIVCRAQSHAPLLLQEPTLSKDQIAFAYAGDLWSVDRNGGDAKRLTNGVGVETDPHFSPDGTLIAFTGQYDGNTDVFVMPASGGVPRRLTYHPAEDSVVGWTPDGKRILFVSGRNGATPVPRLFSIAREGGMPEELPLPTGVQGCYSPDGVRLAYVPTIQWQRAWKRYHGGQTTPIWLVSLSDLKIEKVPRSNSNDSQPMWVGGTVYFLSDRNGPVTLFGYDTKSKRVTQLIKNDGLDIKSASAGPGAIVYEQFGSVHLYDLASGKEQRLNIRVAGDMPEVRPRYVKIADQIQSFDISPTGARALFEARGEILTAPAEKGDIRDLTNTPGVAERFPAWSPDGRWIACFSDESGEYALHIRDQSGKGAVKKITLGSSPSFYYNPVWSPDSKKIAYTDKHLNFWYVDVEKGTPVKVDTDTYETPFLPTTPVWSRDSQWLAYSRQLKNHMGAIFVYSLETGKSSQITDGLSDARYVDFDKSGKYLFFTASTDDGPTTGWIDLSSVNHPVTRSVYIVVLRKDLPSPLAPESDEEKPEEKKPDATKPDEKKPDEKKDGSAPAAAPKPADKGAEKVRIDLDNIGQRILSLPIPARNYIGLTAGKEGNLFLLEGSPVYFGFSQSTQTLHQFDLTKRKLTKFLDNVSGFSISANGEKLIYAQGPRYAIVATAAPPAPDAGTLNLSDMEVRVDPRAEWKQMYHEVWRIERDFLYDPGTHGLNIPATEKEYAPYLEGIASRADLNYLFEEMLGNITIGHMFIGGGDQPRPTQVRGGLLGADYTIENGRYRFARVYNGENWNPNLRAPLTQPGVNVVAGEYLLAVNGRDVLPAQEVYAYFEATAGKQVTLKVGPSPDGKEAREVVVVPVESEYGLRNLAWIEDNRRKVDQMSGGRVAYVYLPDTANGGYTNFNRYYFAQVGREGAVIDERYNGGGFIADYIIDYLRRPLMGYMTQRDGTDYATPAGSIYGPKVMLINEYAGSGGDALPWMFRAARIGPLIGKRTWGGLVGIFGYPPLLDGGFVTAPRTAFWNPNGTWDVENHGVNPDIEVENDPESVRAGHDLQLEKAVAVVLEELQKNPLPQHKKPAYPNYQNGSSRATASR
jgi:tricorn protease